MAENDRVRWHPKSTALAVLMLILSGARPTLAGPPFSDCLFPVGQAPTGTAAGDFNGDGLQDLAVTNSMSNDVSVLLGRADGTFEPEVRFPVGRGPVFIAIGDFNRDGRADLAVANSTFNGRGDVSILLGRGDGTFGPESRLPAGYGAAAIALGDFDENGTTDLVVVNSSDTGASLLTGNGDGTFAAEVRFGGQYDDVASADFNDDGHLDLAVTAPSYFGPGPVLVLLGRGDGSFLPGLAMDVDGTPLLVRVGDFNADSRPDLAVAVYSYPHGSVSILLGAGDGSFIAGALLHPGHTAVGMTAGDLNGDGLGDLAVAGIGSSDVPAPGSEIVLFLGEGGGSFAPPRSFNMGVSVNARSMVIGEFNHDTHPDIAVAAATHDEVALFWGEGDGTFGVTAGPAVGFFAYELAVDDFNADGLKDVAVINQGSDLGSVLLGRGDGTFEDRIPIPPTAIGAAYSLGVADFNEDGRRDLAMLDFYGNVWIYSGRGNGSFEPQTRTQIEGGATYFAMTTGDFDADGLADVAVVDRSFAGTAFVLLGRGDGTFQPAVHYDAGPLPNTVRTGDVTGDGVPDLITANTYLLSGFVMILPGLGDGTFAPARRLEAGGSAEDVRIGDFNSDGRQDLAVADFAGNSVSILLGIDGGSFRPFELIAAGDGPSSIAVADFNGDGRQDLVVSDFGDGGSEYVGRHVALLQGNGDGSFSPLVRLRAGPSPVYVAQGDLTFDGRPDIVVASYRSGALSVLLNKGPFPDSDGDGVPDPFDPCTDSDHDGFGDPEYRANTCAADNCPGVANSLQEDHDLDGVGDACDNCPDVANASQVDRDRDHLGDVCDACIDTDQDGLGNPGFPANSCPIDNCPVSPNPGQEDQDRDGIGNVCDHCTDTDGDTFGDPGFPDSSCLPDNCPDVPNASQGDLDADGVGDACDPCTDYDGDGYASPGFPASLCPLDNCPTTPNPGQQDQDRDGIGDVCDYCTDTDGDGYGDPFVDFSYCSVDNCPAVPNPHQEDGDRDRLGDACDPCPLDPADDGDHDGLCANQDNCPGLANADQADEDADGSGDLCDNCLGAANFPQTDSDADGVGDACDSCPHASNPDRADSDEDGLGNVCDNCPMAANFDQLDSNQDGSGDACQPFVMVAGIAPEAPGTLRATIVASDPQGDSLSGHIEFFAADSHDATLQDVTSDLDCSLGYLPARIPGEGIGFANGSIGQPVLFDLDGNLGCRDGLQDFAMAAGGCEQTSAAFGDVIYLSDLPLPAPLCIRPAGATQGGVEFTVLDFNLDSLTAHVGGGFSVLDVPFASGLPAEIGLTGLAAGSTYRMIVTVTDGTTVPVEDGKAFVYHGESTMLITVLSGSSIPPQARIVAAPQVECTGIDGALVTLDGSLSTDADSSPGTNDDIKAFEWFEDFGLPTQEPLGIGPLVSVSRPLGNHAITLLVTDSTGLTDSAVTLVSVRDTSPPLLTLAVDRPVLWPPNHRLVPVRISWQASDRCDAAPVVSLISALSNEPDDAPGGGDGGTSGDVADAEPGTPDGSILLRAERSADGAGRIYTLLYSIRDASGNTVSALALVGVPHNLEVGPEPLQVNVEATGSAQAARAYWSAVPGAISYDVIVGGLEQIKPQANHLSLGTVRVLGAGVPGTSLSEDGTQLMPALGHGLFYLVQYRGAQGPSGFGTESALLPSEPASCDGGCPGEASGGGAMDVVHRK